MKYYYVKFLPEQFNIASGHDKIQITTLEICKGLEGNLGDVHEGLTNRALTFEGGQSFKSSQINELFGVRLFGDNATITGGGSILVGGFVNIPIFCTSLLREDEISLDFAKQFKNPAIDSYFVFDQDTAEKLVEHINNELLKNYAIDDFDPTARPIIKNHDRGIAGILQWYRYGAVIYEPVQSAEWGHVFSAYDDVTRARLAKTFLKDKAKFAANKEFRAVFNPWIESGPVSKGQPKIATLLDIDRKRSPFLIDAPKGLNFIHMDEFEKSH